MKISVETAVKVPLNRVWDRWIVVDLRKGGKGWQAPLDNFCRHIEAKSPVG